jgi:hypothetical protein
MNRKILFMSVGLFLILTAVLVYVTAGNTIQASSLNATPGENRAPWDNHKMHFPQLPDEGGWDVHVGYPMFLADDWQCSETGPITDIHFWGSWLHNETGVIDQFIIKIWSDIPASPPDVPYSRPGQPLWVFLAPQGAFTATQITPDPSLWEGWYDPSVPTSLINDHQQYWQYDIILPQPAWFPQVQGTIYWISIEALLVPGPTPAYWGWKSTKNHFNDDACYGDGQGWTEIYEPAEVLHNWFEIQLDPAGQWVGGYGIGAYIDPLEPPPPRNGWYQYTQSTEPWWNIWFFDHPLDMTRIKDIWIEYSVRPLMGGPMWADVTPNWATDIWTTQGMPQGENRPPLPRDFMGGMPPEALWIGRGVPPNSHVQPGDARYDLRIGDYNPEWVSVDVRGFNVWVEGTIYHTCRGSLDLAFVITSDYTPPPTGACCYMDPTGLGTMLCTVVTQADCNTLGGQYQGDGTQCSGNIEACCLPDGSCIMADVYCCTNELGGTPQGPNSNCTSREACCLTDGSCQMLDPLCCVDLGGTPHVGEICTAIEACCLPNGDCRMLDPVCCLELQGIPQGQGSQCTAPEACCFNDGSCQDLDPLCCIDLGGRPMGQGTNCATTICEIIPETPKNWYQPPDLTVNGMDVLATNPRIVLADDFYCTKTEPIAEIHIWGSWLNDILPGGNPGNVSFRLSLHSDIPAGGMEPWSQPGEMLRQWIFEPSQFTYKEVKLTGAHEGWYDPMGAWVPIGDHKCFEYIFTFNESNWFIQQGSLHAPVIYWLDVQAFVPDQIALFGWKTSVNHWNDDAVWFEGEDIPVIHPWMELRYPIPHPYMGTSIDLAFLIGGPCDCEPGEADGATPINILDIVYLINYKYKGGPAPKPYALCSGDATCNCVVDILDIVHLINYKYKNGPAPCTCANFIANCPGGLRE